MRREESADRRAATVPRRLRFFDDLKPDEPSIHLPLIQCRECHVTGWGAVKRAAEQRLERDLRVFYNRFFLRDVDVVYLFPADAPRGVRGFDGFDVRVCGACGTVLAADATACSGCRSERLVHVFRPHSVEPRGRGKARSMRLSRDCPYCGAREALIIFGARAASLLSVALGQAQGSRYNDDRKVIAFSDNVQDAAHRAGFFAARTASVGVRAAVAQVVERNDGIALADLPARVETWWRDTRVNPEAFDDERFVSEFIAPDRLWRRDFATLQRDGRLPAGSRLPEAVAERLRWDTLAELGYRSAIGRTLERTRAAAVGVDREALERAVRAAQLRIREKFGTMRDLGPETVRTLVLGVLRRMKDRGAIRSDVTRAWLAAGGGLRWLSRRPALQDFGPRSARPVFPVDAPHAGDGIEPMVASSGGRKSWYQAWAQRILTPVDVLAATREAPDVLLEALHALEDAGLVCRLEAGRDARAWALDPARFYATARTAVMRCTGSSRTLVVPEHEADLWLGAPCLDLGVHAVYDRHAVEPPTWFGRLYRETRVRRLVAAEHTALLTRDERDRLQQRFSNPNPRPWEPNLLSATPTLELGIDVGDLSTVVLCSVPPAQANYLQRIGRAGRRDGNAFTATVATGQPHDLYYYAEPLAMLAGRIEPPGVFLNAPAVLERQLTAFCLDGWAATGLPEDAVPRTIRHVLDNVEQARLTGFPYPFLDFVQRRGDDLLEAFFDALVGELTGQSRDYLTAFLHGDDEALPSLRSRMVNRLLEIAGERKALRADVEALGRRNLLSVFEKAREALKSCACHQDPLKDGCHRCVFAYRRSREMAETSRDTAIEMLDRILARRDELEEVRSLGGLEVNATLESELEARFVEALRRVEVDGRRAVQVRADLVRGKPGYVLKVGDHSYYMETQAELGASEGIVEPCRPDFLIRPARPEPGQRPVAVFTDGFEFHRDQADADSLKRMALIRAGFLVWSLTWHDLEFVFGKAPDVPDLLAGTQASGAMAALQRTLDARWGTANLRAGLAEPTLTLLVNYLQAPEPCRWKQAVFTALFALFDQGRMLSGKLRAGFDRAAAALPGQVREALSDLPPPVAMAGLGAWVATSPTFFDLLVALPLAAVQQGDADAAAIAVHLHDDEASRESAHYRRTWNGVLRLFTLLQFLPGAWWTTRVGVERDVYPEFAPLAENPAAPAPGSGPRSDKWREVIELASPALHALLEDLSTRGAPVPEAGFELPGSTGAVLAEAELGWPENEVAVLLADQQAQADAFKQAGWRVFAADVNGLAEAVANALANDT